MYPLPALAFIGGWQVLKATFPGSDGLVLDTLGHHAVCGSDLLVANVAGEVHAARLELRSLPADDVVAELTKVEAVRRIQVLKAETAQANSL